jgi:glutamyl-tRNA synthetase
MTTKTRFAPSPTGFMHVGNARSALFPWLIAQKEKGVFVLRLEDTDQARLVDGAVEHILAVLNWLGLSYTEGPYVQSERKDVYLKYAKQLIAAGCAYADPYSKEQLETWRNECEAAKKPFLYRNYRPTNPPVWDETQALRFKIDTVERSNWHDEVMGDLSAGEEALDDFILIKADGLPTYNFAHIIDDYEMGITHVIRGLEYISSTPKYLALYKALGIAVPKLASLPHIMADNGKKKLGKRDGAKDILEYKRDGYVSDVMVNFLASLGWNDGTDKETYTREELIQAFSLNRVLKSGAKFDEKRLEWMNGEYIRQLSIVSLKSLIESYLQEYDFEFYNLVQSKPVIFEGSLPLIKERIKTLAEYKEYCEQLFMVRSAQSTVLGGDNDDSGQGRMTMQKTKENLEKLEDWKAEKIGEVMMATALELNVKNKDYFMTMRMAIFGKSITPPLNESMELLGKEEVLARLVVGI